MKVSVLRRASAFGVVATLALAGTAGAVIALPSDGSQVNNDPADGIDPDQNAGVSDIVGGSLAAAVRACRGRRSSSRREARSASSCARSRTASGSRRARR